MGNSARMFLQMRANEMADLYPSSFSKKDAKETGRKLVEDLLESGEVDKMRFGANLIRLNEVISSAVEAFRESIIDIDKQSCMGMEFVPTNGRLMIQYQEDHLWSELNEKIKDRTELLKLAEKSKDAIYDSEGIEVPKCSVNYSKSSVIIKF